MKKDHFSNSQLVLSDAFISFSSNLTLRDSVLSFTSDSFLQVGGCLLLEDTEGVIRLREEEAERLSEEEEISITIVEYNCLEGEFDSFVVEREEIGSGLSICEESIEYGARSTDILFLQNRILGIT